MIASFFIAVLPLLFVLSPAVVAQAESKPHPAVCRVIVEEHDGQAWGSGTLIDVRDQYGLVVTNWHVVRDASGTIQVQFPNGTTSEARPLKLDETWDLAALVIWRPPTKPVTLAQQAPQPGDRLTICGYGGGNYLAQTGRCTEYYSPEVGQPQELVELNVQARQGDSGGPIFNARGELAGVLFGASQGTTLGSFGGRVGSFLATLAPNLGYESVLAGGEPSSSSGRSPSGKSPSVGLPGLERPSIGRLAAVERPQNEARDPFLAAERASSPSLASVLPPSLADRSSAPQLATARSAETRDSSAWQSALSLAGSTNRASRSMGFQPNRSNAAEQKAAASHQPVVEGPVLDWASDSRDLLALVGIAALVVTGLRAIG